MLNRSRTQILLMSLLILFFSAEVVLANAEHDHSVDAPDSEGEFSRPEKEIILISDEGIVPEQVVLNKLDGSVFFVNATRSSLLTFQIEFGEHRPHCASGNLKYDKNRKALRSIEPVGPKDFALLCFPEKGTYPAKISGLDNGRRVGAVKIIVR